VTAAPATRDRAEALAQLAGAELDVLVIGGGVAGAGTAWPLARQGLRVAVLDARDLAGATSSASSKLVHGGLRYLAMRDVGLVREAHAERRANARIVAPHLVRPLPFLVPLTPETPYRTGSLLAGTTLYEALSAFGDGLPRRLDATAAKALAPALDTGRVTGAVRYHDHVTHDARLTLAVLDGAAQAGALVVNHVDVTGLHLVDGCVRGAAAVDRRTGRAFDVHARVVVNATGPWTDTVRRLERPGAAPSVQLSRGTHLVLAADEGWEAAVTAILDDGRVAFAVPFEDGLLLGTTDHPYHDDPAAVAPDPADERQVLEEAARSLLPSALDPARIRQRFAGLRALPVATGPTSQAPREVVVGTGAGGMVSIAGGKLTTWRRIGLQAAALACEALGVAAPDRRPRPLPSAIEPLAAEAELGARFPDVPAATVAHLVRYHGAAAAMILERTTADRALLEPLAPGAPDIAAQVAHARDREWATDVDDVVRRTGLAPRGADDAGARDRIARLLQGGP
jgi:glycerol-3-phosphate dehydrogenase